MKISRYFTEKKIKYGRLIAMGLSLTLIFSLTACGKKTPDTASEIKDPYEGMVSVSSGVGTKMWVKKYDNVAVNPFCLSDYKNTKEAAETDFLSGVDVSEHQWEIDWRAVKRSGIDFAVIRAGYRGYSEGGLFKDAFFSRNIEGASNAGLDFGVYFFSQAISPEEAEAEAKFVIELLGDYKPKYPVYYDWERITTDYARTDSVKGAELTDIALAFCNKIKEAGFTPGLYADRMTAYYDYNLEAFEGVSLWVGALNSYPDFYYSHDIWQRSVTGTVPGISGEVDLDLMFAPKG